GKLDVAVLNFTYHKAKIVKLLNHTDVVATTPNVKSEGAMLDGARAKIEGDVRNQQRVSSCRLIRMTSSGSRLAAHNGWGPTLS
ncbi:hypothetical protein L195_g049295, partial [Trifolium pratense]